MPRKRIRLRFILDRSAATGSSAIKRQALLARWRFSCGDERYVLEHRKGVLRAYIANTPAKRARSVFTYSRNNYSHSWGKRVLLAFTSHERREIEDTDLLNKGLASFMLKAAENDCLLAHSESEYVSEPLILGGNTESIGILGLFLANGYKLSNEAWSQLARSRIASRLGIEFKEGNETRLVKALRAIQETDFIESEKTISLYKEMNEPNELEQPSP